MIDTINSFLLPLELEVLDLVVGWVAGLFGGKGLKVLLLRFYPSAAPFFSFFDRGQKEMSQVLTAADSQLHKNEDLRKWALDKGLKIAANLIKK